MTLFTKSHVFSFPSTQTCGCAAETAMHHLHDSWDMSPGLVPASGAKSCPVRIIFFNLILSRDQPDPDHFFSLFLWFLFFMIKHTGNLIFCAFLPVCLPFFSYYLRLHYGLCDAPFTAWIIFKKNQSLKLCPESDKDFALSFVAAVLSSWHICRRCGVLSGLNQFLLQNKITTTGCFVYSLTGGNMVNW